MTVKYRWETIQIGRWDLLKGHHDRLMEVTAQLKQKLQRLFIYKFGTSTTDRLIQGDRLMRCRLVQVRLYSALT